MKLWLISQDRNTWYDTYDSAVVAAEDEERAIKIHPNGDIYPWDKFSLSSWTDLDEIKCRYLGEAEEGTKPGVICASFNAG